MSSRISFVEPTINKIDPEIYKQAARKSPEGSLQRAMYIEKYQRKGKLPLMYAMSRAGTKKVFASPNEAMKPRVFASPNEAIEAMKPRGMKSPETIRRNEQANLEQNASALPLEKPDNAGNIQYNAWINMNHNFGNDNVRHAKVPSRSILKRTTSWANNIESRLKTMRNNSRTLRINSPQRQAIINKQNELRALIHDKILELRTKALSPGTSPSQKESIVTEINRLRNIFQTDREESSKKGGKRNVTLKQKRKH